MSVSCRWRKMPTPNWAWASRSSVRPCPIQVVLGDRLRVFQNLRAVVDLNLRERDGADRQRSGTTNRKAGTAASPGTRHPLRGDCSLGRQCCQPGSLAALLGRQPFVSFTNTHPPERILRWGMKITQCGLDATTIIGADTYAQFSRPPPPGGRVGPTRIEPTRKRILSATDDVSPPRQSDLADPLAYDRDKGLLCLVLCNACSHQLPYEGRWHRL